METSAVKRKKMKVSNCKPQSSQMSGGCLEGMTSAELTMVRRLAGNDPAVRKKTLRKLKKWLNAIAQKIPDTPECRSTIEPNFIRVWKALFYCMWMADKPLPQEQLAESLSDMQNIFADKASLFLLFVECFLRTMGREWNWIDRFRLDKFMMLFRRFLRKSLIVLAQRKWHNEVLEGFLKIISTYIFNHHPPPKSKKQPATPSAMSPLGLQIHFTDIFMEELAKVGGQTIKFSKILKIITVFIQELGYSNDDRLLDEIRDRIFNHLMRQSDIGIDYQEQLAFGAVEEGCNIESSLEEEGDNVDEVFVDDEGENDMELDMQNDTLDPRAGAVDVILPQLDIDYDKLYKKLIEFGGQKDVKLKNRRLLYRLASEFKEITEGKYPLALPEDVAHKPAILRKEVNSAAKRLLQSEINESTGKRRKNKKERKRDARKRLNASLESAGSEDNSQYINDVDLLEHVTDNYMSYLEDEVNDKLAVGEAKEETAKMNVDESDGIASPSKQKKKQKSKKRKWKTMVEVEADDNSDGKSAPTSRSSPNDSSNQQEEVILIKRAKLSKRSSLGSNAESQRKIRRLSELRTPKNSVSMNSSDSKSSSRRVSFVLARNLEHEHADYPVSIARSPAIPYDKHKLPTSGLLKSPGTPIAATHGRKGRPSALDFF